MADFSVFNTSDAAQTEDEKGLDFSVFKRENPVLQEAVKVPPAEQAKVIKLSRETGLPSNVIEGDVSGFETDLKQQRVKIDSTTPATQQWFSDFDNAAISHDDVDTLKALEAAAAGIGAEWYRNDAGEWVHGVKKPTPAPAKPELFSDIAKSWGQGSGQFTSGLGQLAYLPETAMTRLVNDLTAVITGEPSKGGQSPLADWLREIGNETSQYYQRDKSQYSQERAAEVEAAQGFWGTLSAYMNNPSQIVEGVTASLPSFVGPAVASRFSKALGLSDEAITSVTATTVGATEGAGAGADTRQQVLDMTFAELIEGSSAFRELTKTMSEDEARRVLAERAGLTAQAITTPLAAIVSKITGAAGIESEFVNDVTKLADFKKFLRSVAAESSEEVAQAVTSQFSTNVGLQEYANENVELTQGLDKAAASGLILGVAQSGGMNAVSLMADSYINVMAERDRQALIAARYDQEQQTIDDIDRLASQSQLRQLDDETFVKFMQQVDGDKNAQIYIDGYQLKMYIERYRGDDSGAELLRSALGEAAELGQPVAIPMPEFAAHIAGSPHFAALREFMSINPDSPSPFNREQSMESAREYVERLMNEADSNVSLYAEKQALNDELTATLTDTGRMNARDASISASVATEYIANFARRNGMTFADARAKVMPIIEGPLTGERARLESELQRFEQIDTSTDAFRNWFGDSKIVDESGAPLVLYHGTANPNITEFQPRKKIEKDSGWYGEGIYFTANPELASIYAGVDSRMSGQRGAGTNLIPAYVSITNPYVWPSTRRQAVSAEEAARVRDELEAAGYDGVIVRGPDGSFEEVVAFNSTQIKSSVGNRGTFDPNDPNILNQDSFDYRDEHTAPDRESGASLSDLTMNDIYPDDVYSSKGPQYYGTGSSYDKEAFAIANKVKGNPDAKVKIYRSVPKGITKINPGDWVAITRGYAVDHGESRFDGEYDILEMEVRAGDLFTNNDSILEWGYSPETFNQSPVASAYPLADRDSWWGDYNYAENGGRLVEMSPTEYLSQVAPIDTNSEMTLENVGDLVDHINDGGELDPLVIYKDGKEDGRHRALAAIQLGIATVPVIDYRESTERFNQSSTEQTETEAFKNWFGESKIVNEDGSPMVLYHGTDSEFDTFSNSQEREPGNYGEGFYFTGDKWLAQGYAQVRSESSKGSPRVMSVFISIKNPFIINIDSDKTEAQQKFKPIVDKDEARAFTRQLKEKGYDGVVVKLRDIDSATGEIEYESYEEVIAFSPEQIKSAIGNKGTFDPTSPNILEQKTRGYYEPANALIRLTEASDLSTFLHEFAHHMYEMELTLDGSLKQPIHDWFIRNAEAVAKEASSLIGPDFDDLTLSTVTPEMVNTYLTTGTTGIEQFDNAIRVATHEQFARGFEAYLMEGKAPSVEMRNVFQTIARWLVSIYRQISKLNVNLDDQARDFFDRLLASEDQIQQARARTKYEPLFTDATMAGMTETEFEKYNEKKNKVVDEAVETLRDKLVSEFTRKTEKWWKDEKADVIEDQLIELRDTPTYRAIETLRNGTEIKLDYSTVLDMVGETRTDKRGVESRRLPASLNRMTVKGSVGMSPDDAAAIFGFSSGSEMIQAIMAAKPIRTEAADRAEAVMIERHGDILNDGTIQKLADEAMMNETRGELLLMELKQLAKNTPVSVIEKQELKNLATTAIGNLSFREIHPAKYRAAEVKAAQESARALASGDREAATAAKTRQIINHYLAIEAQRAKDDVMKIVDGMARYDRKNVREAIQRAENGYWEQIQKLLARFEFRKGMSLKAVAEGNAAIESWAKDRIETDGDGLVLTPEVLNELYITHWKNVPYSQLLGIRDSIKNIEHVARYANKIKAMGEELDFKELVSRWTDHLNSQPENFKPSQRTEEATSENRKWGAWMMAQMTKIPYLTSWMDGGERVGMSQQILMQPFTDAYAEEQKLWRDVGLSVISAIESRSPEDRKRHARNVFIPEIKEGHHDGNLTGAQIIAVALNTGNAGNLRKMLLGEGWANPEDESTVSLSNPKLQAILRHMTESDWQLVQLIWDKMELLYPQLAEVHRRTTGLVPPKVEATPVQTPFGEFKGGYYPMKYSPKRSFKDELNAEKNDAVTESMFSTSGSIQASVNASATNARTQYYAPILLSLEVVPNHFQEVIHYITHHDAVRQTNKLLRNKAVADSIKRVVGPEEYAQLRPWLRDIAKDGRETPAKMFWDKAIQKLRLGATLGMMGFKAGTVLMQFAGVTTSMAEIGTANFYHGMRKVLGSPRSMSEAWEFASSKSKILSTRVNSMDRELKSVLDNLAGKSGFLPAVQEASMKGIAYTQTYMIDLPTWYGAYVKAMKDYDGDEQRAYQYADWVVENTQGSGLVKDAARIMRNQTETGRMLTMFMTFFSTLWNIERDLARGIREGRYSITTVAAKVSLLFIIPTIYDMIVKGDFSDDDDDEMAQKLLLKLALYPMSSVPFVRDIATGVSGEFAYNISPIAQMIETGVRTIPAIATAPLTDDEITASQVKGATKVIGAWYGVPGVNQAWATGESLYDVIIEGEERTLREILVTGPDRDK